MSTTQFRPPEPVSVQLPLSTSEVHVPETDTIILTVTESGDVYISSAAGTDAVEVPPDSLFDAIVAWRTRNPAAVVVLKGTPALVAGAGRPLDISALASSAS